MTDITAVILAAGRGTRMKSDLPKVLHEVGRLPLLHHVLHLTRNLAAARTIVVTAPDQDCVRRTLPADCLSAVQDRPLGTAHAVLAARHLMPASGVLLVLFGADPLLTTETVRRMIDSQRGGNALTVLASRPASTEGLGRVILNADGSVDRIVEEADASPDEKRITLCNAGAMAIDQARAVDWLSEVSNANRKGEYYLTDLIAIANRRGQRVGWVEAGREEVVGVDDRADLVVSEQVFQRRKRAEWLSRGVTLTQPETVFLAHDTTFGRDVVVEPFVTFGPGVSVPDGVRVPSFSRVGNGPGNKPLESAGT
ncbi:MAG: NTP transferase domain-containing protein [Alphaproteobacteria bacterium]|nr:NTP transferase domain-containing protein [Alphaproteobacteria bacterium]